MGNFQTVPVMVIWRNMVLMGSFYACSHLKMMIIILLVSIKNHDISSTSKLDVNELQKKY